MAVTASIFLSPIFKGVIEVFSLAQTIIKIKYYIGIYGSTIYRSYDTCTCIALNVFTQKALFYRTTNMIFQFTIVSNSPT